MACENCLTSAKGLDEARIAVQTEAKRYANANQVTVGIWREGFEYKYGTIDGAAAGKPVFEMVYPDSRLTP